MANNIAYSEFIVNARINQVCMGLHQVQFKFSNSATIGIGLRIDIVYKNGRIVSWNNSKHYQRIEFDSILEQKVVDCYIDPQSNNLELEFESGVRAIIYSGSDGLESYNISYMDYYHVVH